MRLAIREKNCTGCQSCQLACAVHKTGRFSLKQANIRLSFSADPFRKKIVVCRQCRVCRCMEACKYNAFLRAKTGGVHIDEAECQACLACVDACPFGAVKVDPVKKLPAVCDLCGGQPRCLQACRTGAISAGEARLDR